MSPWHSLRKITKSIFLYAAIYNSKLMTINIMFVRRIEPVNTCKLINFAYHKYLLLLTVHNPEAPCAFPQSRTRTSTIKIKHLLSYRAPPALCAKSTTTSKFYVTLKLSDSVNTFGSWGKISHSTQRKRAWTMDVTKHSCEAVSSSHEIKFTHRQKTSPKYFK